MIVVIDFVEHTQSEDTATTSTACANFELQSTTQKDEKIMSQSTLRKFGILGNFLVK